MLGKLFTSRTRCKILTLFMLNPGEEMYIREITKVIHENINSVRRELSNLEDLGLLISRRAGNLKYYQVNQDFTLYPELYSMVLKTEGVSGLLNENLAELGQIDLAFIYGSFAACQAGPESDLDLLLVGELHEDELIKELAKLERELRREINYVLLSKEEYMARLKNKDSFLSHVLKEPKIMLSGDLNVE
jgi:predicted nucleotidyltransferase